MSGSKMRVQKYLSRAGVCSRREGERMMEAGRVSVNGEVCTEMGSKVDPNNDRVEVDGREVSLPDKFTYVLLNKPEHYLSTLDDPKGRPIVTDLLPDDLPRLWPVGRLDWESTGAVLMTNDGKLTHGLTHPSYKAHKHYRVVVAPELSDNSRPLHTLRKGVELDSGEKTQPAQVSILRQLAGKTELRFTLTEGKNRQIRRMADAVDRSVEFLERTGYGPVALGAELDRGDFRHLNRDEVEALYGEIDTPLPERAQI